MNTKKMYPKRPPCTQYKGTQILYTRNKKNSAEQRQDLPKKILNRKNLKL